MCLRARAPVPARPCARAPVRPCPRARAPVRPCPRARESRQAIGEGVATCGRAAHLGI